MRAEAPHLSGVTVARFVSSRVAVQLSAAAHAEKLVVSEAALHRYSLVDLGRCIAALSVLVYHVIYEGGWTDYPYDGAIGVLRIGWIGVDFFFVISGFVIGLSALQGMAIGPKHWRRLFAGQRVRRVVPLYLLTCATYLLLVDPDVLIWGAGFAAMHLVPHALFIQNMFFKTYNSINPPSWSIALEMQFYLLMLLCTPWLARAGVWRVLLTGTGIALAWRYATTLIWVPGISDPARQAKAAAQLPGVLDAFGFGIVLAKLTLGGHMTPSWKRFVGWLLTGVALLWCAHRTFEADYWSQLHAILGWRLLLAAGFAVFLGALIVCPTDGGWLTWPLRYLGVISYGIYLWHYPILQTFKQHTPWRGLDLLIAVFIATVVLSALSWHGFEKLLLRKPPPSVPAQAARSL